MRQASVGFQCPDCVSAAAAASPQVTAAALAVRDERVTRLLIGLNAAVFVVGLIGQAPVLGGVRDRFAYDYGLVPLAVGQGEWWRLVTAGFLHGGLLHLAVNMFALMQLGRVLERPLGPRTFGALYALGLAGGSLGVVLLAAPNSITVGASGAIFGLMGALGSFELMAGRNPMSSGIGTVVVINLALTFLIPGISIGGHLGGLVAGAAGGAIVAGARRKSVPDAATTAAIAGLAVVVLGSAALFAPAI